LLSDESQSRERQEYEVSKLEANVKDSRDEIERLASDRARLQNELQLQSKRLADAEMQVVASRQRVADTESECQALRESRATLQREIEMLHGVAATHRKSFAESSIQIEKLQRELQQHQKSSSEARQITGQRDSEHAQEQLSRLRDELHKAVSDWKESEKEKQVREEMVRRLQNELSKERSRAHVLGGQISELEYRLRVANKDLAAFRGLDVYQSTREAELASYRSKRFTDVDGESRTSAAFESRNGEIGWLSARQSVSMLPRQNDVDESDGDGAAREGSRKISALLDSDAGKISNHPDILASSNSLIFSESANNTHASSQGIILFI
jgi:septal ring factor EnvC (AmiA/AmiB activator)